MACPKCGCKVTYQYDDSDEDLAASDERLERCSACGEIFDIEEQTPEDEDDHVDQ